MISGVSAQRWSQIRKMFDELVELDARSRGERLAVIEATDPELGYQVTELLAADREAEARLAHVGVAITRAAPVYDRVEEDRDADSLKLVGRTISHFTVLQPLAAGGMGVVYLAEDTQLHRTVALKFPLPSHPIDRRTKERFLHEARSVGALDHPNVCSIFEAGETDDGHLFFAMPLYDGQTLKARLTEQGALAHEDARAIARQIAAGLAAAHRRGIVHRDVKPANVMLLRDGAVKVLDFGLAKVRDLTFTAPQARVGTASYMSPEQIQGHPVDSRSDVWALGVILYEMLTGRRPFAGEYDVSIAHAIVHEPVPPMGPQVPTFLAELVMRCLEKDPARRPDSAAELLSSLDATERRDNSAAAASAERLVAGDSLNDRAISGPTGPPAPRRWRAIAWAMAGVVVVVGIALVVAMRRPRDRAAEFVVVADFATAAADSQIADWLTESTRRALSASRSLGAAPDVRVLAARRRLHVQPSARLTVQLARYIAIGDGIRSVVAGSLKSFAGSYAISLSLLSASSGERLATAAQAGIMPHQLFTALDTLTRRLREQAGDDLEAIHAQPSLLALTSTSLDAMTDYVTAVRLPRDSAPRAVELLREAVTLDTSFASALWQLSRYMEGTRPATDAEHRALLARAWNHRNGLTEYERMRVEIAYKYSPNGTTPDPNEHLERLRRIVERYPNADDADILADMYLERRDLSRAERAYRLATALDPTKADSYVGVIRVYLNANRIGDARRATDEFARRVPGSPSVDMVDATVSYAEGRRDRAREILRRLEAFTGQIQLGGYIGTANLDLVEGRVKDFEREMSAKDSLVGLRPDRPGLRANRLLASYWVMHRPDQGLRMLESALAADTSLRSDLRAAEFYAQFGRPDSARALLAARGVTDWSVYLGGADTLRVSAWIDLAEGRPRDAARKFRENLRFSGGNAPSQIALDAETGLAFERAGLPDSAIATYEHYLNAPPTSGMDAFRLVWILEHVAPLYEKKGSRKKAREMYARVAELWKNADPDLQPRVSYARERAAALR